MTRTPKPKPQATRPLESLLKPSEAAAFLGVHENTLRSWRAAGTGPRYTRIGSRVIRYRVADLLVATP